MKIKPETILFEKKIKTESGIYFISGNDETYISKISDLLISKLKDDGYSDIINNHSGVLDADGNNIGDVSLFFDKKIVVYKNTKKVEVSDLDALNYEKTRFIILDNNTKSSSKIKKYFDTHPVFLSITCYKISPDIKKTIVDFFIREKKISFDAESYWFFIENSSNEYQILENEINKIALMGEVKIDINTLRLLLSSEKKDGVDGLFFSLILSNNKVLLNTRKMIVSQGDAYLFLYRVVFFINIAKKQMDGLGENLFPKYLFREKNVFNSMVKKLDNTKVVEILRLIKKTEILIRKHEKMYLLISQRFVLNLKKNFR